MVRDTAPFAPDNFFTNATIQVVYIYLPLLASGEGDFDASQRRGGVLVLRTSPGKPHP